MKPVLPAANAPRATWFDQGSHPDFRLLQSELLSLEGEETESAKSASKQISVDQVRGLADFSGMSPIRRQARVDRSIPPRR